MNANANQPTLLQITTNLYETFDIETALTVSAALRFARESVHNGMFPVVRYGNLVSERLKSMESE